ncbi:MAG: alanine racemase [Bdellovibrionales bacterium]|nr:alanine racemase [Bdellovibrionales bacterium]
MFRQTFAKINLLHLKYNIEFIRSHLSSDQFLCPMIKANAYGCGVIPVASALRDVNIRRFGVALVEEAVELRENGFQQEDIYVFSTFTQESLRVCKELRLTPIVGSLDDLILLSKLKEQISIHLMFNTGMQRLGVVNEDSSTILKLLENNPQIRLMGICTHLATAEDFSEENSFAKSQLKEISSIRSRFSSSDFHLHALNSAGFMGALDQGIENYKEYGVRPGLLMYGVNTFSPQIFKPKPVMSLISQLIKIQKVNKGQGVSYGHTWRPARDTFIGVVAIGYADGVFRQLSSKIEFLIKGHKVKLVGAVCMDYLMVDLGDIVQSRSEAENLIGEEVLLFGENLYGSADITNVAENAGTNSYDIMSRVGVRVPRVYS